MSLRIAVLEQAEKAGFSLGWPSNSDNSLSFLSGEKGARSGIACQLISVPVPLSTEGICCLQNCHGCLVILPADSFRNKDIRAGLFEDFRELRVCRGVDALTGELPVILVFPGTADCLFPELAEWVQNLNRELGQGFGGFHFSMGGNIIPGKSPPDGWMDCQKWLGLARNYRSRSVWSNARALFTVFCLTFFLGLLICGSILLFTDKQLGDWRTAQRLEYGLIPPRDTLLRSNTLEPMVARLKDLHDFLDSHPNWKGDRRTRLESCRERLSTFVNAILEAGDWASLSDVSDMAGLQALAQSLNAWSFPKVGAPPFPLVEAVEAKRRLIVDASARAQEALSAMEACLAMSDQLLNQGIEGPGAWSLWTNKCATFLNQTEPLEPEDSLWLLEEFLYARQSLQARRAAILGAVELASGLGLPSPSGASPGPFFPGPGKGEPLEKLHIILDKVFKSAGNDPVAFIAKLGPGLSKPLKARCAECRKEWLAIGRNEIARVLREVGEPRRHLRAWVENARKNQSWDRYGKWVEWLGDLEFKVPGKINLSEPSNPILAIERFLAREMIFLRPTKCRLTVPKNGSVFEQELVLELHLLGPGAKRVISMEGLMTGLGVWDFNFSNQDQEESQIVWGWNQSVRLLIIEKKDRKILREIKAASPADAGNLMGDRLFGFSWYPATDGLPVPELLIP